jgi:hypothetical protein
LVVISAACLVVLAAGSAQAGLRVDQPRGIASASLLTRVTVTLSDSKIVLNAKSAKRGQVTFKVTNLGKLKHDFEISGRKTRMLSHGQSDTLRVTFLRKGTYPYKSGATGDVAKGLTGVFTIK